MRLVPFAQFGHAAVQYDAGAAIGDRVAPWRRKGLLQRVVNEHAKQVASRAGARQVRLALLVQTVEVTDHANDAAGPGYLTQAPAGKRKTTVAGCAGRCLGYGALDQRAKHSQNAAPEP